MSTPVFKQVKTSVDPVTGYATIIWTVSPGYKPTSTSLLFYVETAYSGGDWTRLNPLLPVIDYNTYVDTVKRSFNILNDVYYRVIMYDNGIAYASIPEKIGGNLSRQQLRLVNEVMRRKYFQMVKQTGQKGYLLRRKDWGQYCTCYDIDLGNTPSGTCPDCYGVGFVGGYYPAIEFWIEDVTQAGTERHRDGQTGVEMNHMKKSRCVPYPQPAAEDIWVSASSGERYRIFPETLQESYIRDTSMIDVLTLEKISPLAVEYNIPVVAVNPNGWTTGFGMVQAQTDMQYLSKVVQSTGVPSYNSDIVNTFTAGENLAAFVLVKTNSAGLVVKVTGMIVDDLDTCIGMTTTSGLMGSPVQVCSFGKIENTLWALAPGGIVYVGDTGQISYNPELDGLLFEQNVGITETSTRLLIRINKGVII